MLKISMTKSSTYVLLYGNIVNFRVDRKWAI